MPSYNRPIKKISPSTLTRTPACLASPNMYIIALMLLSRGAWRAVPAMHIPPDAAIALGVTRRSVLLMLLLHNPPMLLSRWAWRALPGHTSRVGRQLLLLAIHDKICYLISSQCLSGLKIYLTCIYTQLSSIAQFLLFSSFIVQVIQLVIL